MNILKMLFGSRKPALNKPDVKRSDYIRFDGKDIYKISTEELFQLRYKMLTMEFLPYNDVVDIENELRKRGYDIFKTPLFTRMGRI